MRGFIEGLIIAGPVRPSGIWSPERDPAKNRSPKYTIEQILDRAWDYRSKIREMEVTKASQTILNDTIDEMKMGYCEGIQLQEGGTTHTRGMNERQVIEALGTDRWIPIRRFGVEQRNKIRGVDDASDNLINATSSRQRKSRSPA